MPCPADGLDANHCLRVRKVEVAVLLAGQLDAVLRDRTGKPAAHENRANVVLEPVPGTSLVGSIQEQPLEPGTPVATVRRQLCHSAQQHRQRGLARPQGIVEQVLKPPFVEHTGTVDDRACRRGDEHTVTADHVG